MGRVDLGGGRTGIGLHHRILTSMLGRVPNIVWAGEVSDTGLRRPIRGEMPPSPKVPPFGYHCTFGTWGVLDWAANQ